MGLAVDSFLITVGLMIGAAFFGNVVFRRFRLPDIILLIGMGVVLGPVTHFVDPALFRAIAPLVGTLAIIIILFDGGLKIRRDEMVKGVASGALLAILVFVATALLSALVAHTMIHTPWSTSLLLGMALGGAGAVIVIPLIQHLGVSERAQTIVSIEAAISDVLVVIGVVGFSTALALKQTDPSSLAVSLVQTFSIGIAVGVGAGIGWANALRRFEQRSYEYVLTIAALLLVYSLVEILHGSGALAVLSFGLVVGNSRKTQKIAARHEMRPRGKRSWEYAPVFGLDLQNLHEEMVFFVRAFFFVALGVVMNLDVLTTPRFLLLGGLLSVAVVVARAWGVIIVFGRSRIPTWDKFAISLMFPLGLAAAALSIVPNQKGVAGTQDFGSYAAVVIVITNLLSSILVYTLSTQRIRARFERPDEAGAAPARATTN
jgi:cell volume regulation protein A